jgi:membrane dipeptidase
MTLAANTEPQIHFDSLVVDTHVDTVLHLVGNGRTLGSRQTEGHIDLPRLREGGVNCQFFAHYVEFEYKPDRALNRFLELLDTFYSEVEQNNDRVEVALSKEDILRIAGEGKVAAVISIEGGEPISGDLAVLRNLYRLGVRAIGLTWNERNDIADGVGEWRSAGGLTRFGVEVVEEMNRLGMIVDVSHLSEPSFWDVIEYSHKPVIASHSNARTLCNHVRNLKDEQIRALAENGGVMGVVFAPGFVDQEHATLEGVLDHIDHIVDLVGPDHVGLGSDFDGITSTPEGLEDVSCLPSLTAGLIERGYTERNIEKILGENYLRVFEEVFED